jgi:hypothetical protein
MHALYFISTVAAGIINSNRTLKQINKILRVHVCNVAECSQGAHRHSAGEAFLLFVFILMFVNRHMDGFLHSELLWGLVKPAIPP